MATKKEWAWRGVSFLAGFLTGRYVFPKQYDNYKDYDGTEIQLPSEREYGEALQCILAGIYLCLRCIVKEHQIYEEGKSRLGPVKRARLDGALKRWDFIASKLSRLTVEDYDHLLRQSLNEIITTGTYPPNVKLWISSLDPTTLAHTLPPVGRIRSIAENIARDFTDKSDEYISLISQKIAEKIGSNYVESFQMTGVELGQCFRDLMLSFKPILITAESEIYDEITSHSRDWWFLHDIFTSCEFLEDYKRCDKCGWERRAHRRDGIKLEFDNCPNCGSTELISGGRDLDPN